MQISRHKWLTCTHMSPYNQVWKLHDQLQPYPSSALSFWELQALLHMFASKPALTNDYFPNLIVQPWPNPQYDLECFNTRVNGYNTTVTHTLYESSIHIYFTAPHSAVSTIYVCGSSTQISQSYLPTAGEDWETRNSNVCKRCKHLEIQMQQITHLWILRAGGNGRRFSP